MRKEKVVLRKWGRHNRTHAAEKQKRGHWMCADGVGGGRGMGRRDGEENRQKSVLFKKVRMRCNALYANNKIHKKLKSTYTFRWSFKGI